MITNNYDTMIISKLHNAEDTVYNEYTIGWDKNTSQFPITNGIALSEKNLTRCGTLSNSRSLDLTYEKEVCLGVVSTYL